MNAVDLAKVKAGDTVTARFSDDMGLVTVTGPVRQKYSLLHIGRYSLTAAAELMEHIPAVPEWTAWPMIWADGHYWNSSVRGSYWLHVALCCDSRPLTRGVDGFTTPPVRAYLTTTNPGVTR